MTTGQDALAGVALPLQAAGRQSLCLSILQRPEGTQQARVTALGDVDSEN